MPNLSSLERESLKAQHKKERDKRICDRIKAVLLFDKDWTYSEKEEIKALNLINLFGQGHGHGHEKPILELICV
jgi:hypothetical protein